MPVATVKKRRQPKKRKVYGQYIVADPEICHGQLTFIGTRIFVMDVLRNVAEGRNWNWIIKNWHSSITKEAIAEAVEFSRQVLLDHIDEYTVRPPQLIVLDESFDENLQNCRFVQVECPLAPEGRK